MEITVKIGGTVVGYMDECDAREMIRSGEARIIRKGSDRFLLLRSDAPPTSRVRALSSTSSTRSALSTLQREEVYQGRRTRNPENPQPDVTGVVFALRKITSDGEFVNWDDRERFPRRRWNPDEIPSPAFRSEAEYIAHHASK